MQEKRTAWQLVQVSLREFRVYEWAPFGWILAAQLIFLLCALNIGTKWGMSIAGTATMLATLLPGTPGVAGPVSARLASADALLHYPQFFVVLPAVAAFAEWILYVLAGAVLIPLALLRICGRHEPPGSRDTAARLRRAVPPVFIAGLVNVAMLQAWGWVLGKGVQWLASAGHMPGAPARLLLWLLGALVSFLISAPFLYVPVRAVRRDSSMSGSLLGGIGRGLQLLLPTFLVILVCTWPALLVLAPAQLGAAVIAAKMRPELVVLLLSLYAAITAVANYVVYSSVMRLDGANQT